MFKFKITVKPRLANGEELSNLVRKHFEDLGNVYDNENPDIIFACGGDGTLLNSIKDNIGKNCSYMMINAGTLGFFREYDLDEIDKFFSEFDYDKLQYEEHKLLEISDVYGNKVLACNEFIWASPISTLDLNIFINHSYFMTVKGSGICLASPFGSTGYNHSLGGSLLVGDEGLVLSLIAPIRNKAIHPLINSLVLLDKDEITLEMRNNVECYISADMRPLPSLKGNKFTIKKSKITFKLAHSTNFDNYTRIRRSFVD